MELRQSIEILKRISKYNKGADANVFFTRRKRRISNANW